MLNNSNLAKISIGEIIKDPEMFRLVIDNLKTKKMYKHTVKKLSFLIKYVPDRCKAQQLCDKVIIENDIMIMFMPDQYITQECDNVVNNYPDTLESVPDCFMTQKLCNNAASTYLTEYDLFLINLKLKKCVIKLLILIHLFFILLLIYM